MKSLSARLLPFLAVVALFAQGQARADFVDYSFQWSVDPAAVLPGGTGSVQIAVTPNGSTSSAIGTLNTLQDATLTTSSSATDPPDSFNTPYDLKLHLTDTATGKAGDFSFAGTLSGTLTQNSSTLTSTFSNPVTQTLEIGAHAYAVTISPVFLHLPAPGTTPSAVFNALVKVQNAPEPSSLALGAIAASVFGFAARRRRRRALAAA